MPIGLAFQRRHRKLGYKVKYFSYLIRRRDVLQKKKSYGNSNLGKTIYVVKPDYQDGVEGVLSLLYRQLIYIDYGKRKGYIPFVDWKNYRTQYYDGINNAWTYFFKQPSKISEAEVYKSRNVYLSGWTFKDINPKGLFGADIFFNEQIKNDCITLFNKYIRLSDDVETMVNKEAERLNIQECIGVYVRGTDYVKLKPSGEYIQPDVSQVIPVIHKFLNKHKNACGIYLVTEDGKIFDSLHQEFGDLIRLVSFDSFIRNYDGKDVLSKSNVLDKDKKKRGQDYLTKMVLLSKCKYLISSVTQGSKFSYILNGGKYEDQYIFDLGLYK